MTTWSSETEVLEVKNAPLTCWDWLTLALAVDMLGHPLVLGHPPVSDPTPTPCSALRTQISQAEKQGDEPGPQRWRTSSRRPQGTCARSHATDQMDVTIVVFAASSLKYPRKGAVVVTWYFFEETWGILETASTVRIMLSFPLDEVLVCLDWIEEHPVDQLVQDTADA